MIPNDCCGEGNGEAMRGPVGPRTSFKCCLQVVLVVSKILSCTWNGVIQMCPDHQFPTTECAENHQFLRKHSVSSVYSAVLRSINSGV